MNYAETVRHLLVLSYENVSLFHFTFVSLVNFENENVRHVLSLKKLHMIIVNFC
jgi:hypothetical protein